MVTNNHEVWRDAWSFKDHGKNYDAVYHREHPPGFRWLHDSLGTNWRMTEMQAAIGRVQLRKLPAWTARRAENAKILRDGLASLPALRIPEIPSHVSHAWYKFYAFVRPEALRSGWTRDRIMTDITQKGVPAFVGSCSEVYLETAFTRMDNVTRERLPVARHLGETSLMFLVHPTLGQAQMQTAVEVIRDVVIRATR